MGKYRSNPIDNDNFIINENFDEIINEVKGNITPQKYFTWIKSEHKKPLYPITRN